MAAGELIDYPYFADMADRWADNAVMSLR
jgi:hypothetical protein